MNKNFFHSLTLIVISLLYNQAIKTNLTESTSAVTWIANGGRFGDNLLSFARTKWLSLHNNIELLCPPFPYSDQLMIHTVEQMYTDDSPSFFSAIKNLPIKTYNYNLKDDDTLYICRWKTIVKIQWSDINFINSLKKALIPRYPIQTVSIPDNCISIAVHVRTGGNFTVDNQELKDTHPLRFTPIKILIAQVKRLTKLFKKENLYVHVFTDHPEPQELIKDFKKQLKDPRVSFGYREKNNDHDMNVLEDFFSMMQFDCIVRPQSNFSIFAQRLGKSTIAIFPANVEKSDNGQAGIDVIIIQKRNNEHEAWKTDNIIFAKRY